MRRLHVGRNAYGGSGGAAAVGNWPDLQQGDSSNLGNLSPALEGSPAPDSMPEVNALSFMSPVCAWEASAPSCPRASRQDPSACWEHVHLNRQGLMLYPRYLHAWSWPFKLPMRAVMTELCRSRGRQAEAGPAWLLKMIHFWIQYRYVNVFNFITPVVQIPRASGGKPAPPSAAAAAAARAARQRKRKEAPASPEPESKAELRMVRTIGISHRSWAQTVSRESV